MAIPSSLLAILFSSMLLTGMFAASSPAALASNVASNSTGVATPPEPPGEPPGPVDPATKFEEGFYEKITSLINSGEDREYSVILFTTKAPKGQDDAKKVAERNKNELVEKLETVHNAKRVFKATVLSFVVASVPIREIPELSKYNNVFLVGDGEKKYEPLMDVARTAVNGVGALSDGTGIKVGIVGTGIKNANSYSPAHPDLPIDSTKIISQAFCTDVCVTSGDFDDALNHETFVAGIIGGFGFQNSQFRGIASGSWLINVKLPLDQNNQFEQSHIVKGIDFAVNQGARVLNLSLGAPCPTQELSILSLTADEAMDEGVVVVASSGNAADDNPPPLVEIKEPACGLNAIAVGAINDHNTNQTSDDEWAPYSSRGPSPSDKRLKPDISAPGTLIKSVNWCYKPGDPIFGSLPYDDHTRKVPGFVDCNIVFGGPLQGTSFAAPLVSGAAALLLNRHPEYTPVQVKAALLLGAKWNPTNVTVPSTSLEYESDGSSNNALNSYGFGILDINTSINYSLTGNNILRGNINQGQMKNYTFFANSGQQLKVILSWIEHPTGTVLNPQYVAVSDLNFVVTRPIGTIIKNASSSFQNNEFAVFTADTTGTYTVSVSAKTINPLVTTETFALASTNALTPPPGSPNISDIFTSTGQQAIGYSTARKLVIEKAGGSWNVCNGSVFMINATNNQVTNPINNICGVGVNYNQFSGENPDAGQVAVDEQNGFAYFNTVFDSCGQSCFQTKIYKIDLATNTVAGVFDLDMSTRHPNGTPCATWANYYPYGTVFVPGKGLYVAIDTGGGFNTDCKNSHGMLMNFTGLILMNSSLGMIGNYSFASFTGRGEILAYDSAAGKIWVPKVAGNLYSFSTSTNTASFVTTLPGVTRGIAVNPSTGYVYLPVNAATDSLTVLSGSNGSVVATVPLTGDPWGVTVDPAHQRVYVTLKASGNVAEISTNDHTLVRTHSTGGAGQHLVATSTPNKVFVENVNHNKVSVISFENAPPVANAGNDQSANVNTNVVLNGAGSSDPEGDPITYSWTQTAGPPITLVNANTVTPNFTAPNVSNNTILTFQLIVSDGPSNSLPDTVNVNVVNHSPIANAGLDQAVESASLVTLNGASSSDPDGSSLTYQWTQTAGPAVTLSSSTVVSPTFTAPVVSSATVLTFALVVNDGVYSSSPDSVNITVTPRFFTAQGNFVKALPGSPQLSRPVGDITTGGWTVTPLWDKLDETPASDADFITSPTGTAPQFEVDLPNITDPVSSTGHIIRVRAMVSSGSGGAETATLQLYQGTTQKATSSALTISRTGFTTLTYTLTGAQADSITDYNDLRVRVVTAKGNNEVIQASWIEFEVPAVPAVQSITGLGFQPKALILYTTGQTADGTTDGYKFSIGYSDGTASKSIGVASDDAAGSSNAGRAFGDKVLKIVGSGTPTISAEADLVSFDGGGFTIKWTTNDSTAARVQYVAIGGEAVTNSLASSFAAQTATGSQSVTVGFQPDFLMLMHAASTSETSTASHGYVSYGFAVALGNSGAIAATSEDGRNTMDTWRLQKPGRALVALDETTGSIDAEAQLTAMTTNGFTLNWIDAPAGADRVYYLALKGGRYDVGNMNKTTGVAPVTQNVTSLSFKPAGLILTGVNNVASSAVQSHNRISFGSSNGTLSGAAWTGDTDGADPSVTARSFTTAKVFRLATEAATGSSSTINAEANLQSFNSNGFTLNWTTNNGVATQIIYVVFGKP